jgi:hypothetical protein
MSTLTRLIAGADGMPWLPETNVVTLGAIGDGATSASPAFQAAVEAGPSGAARRIVVPPGSYSLPVTVNNNLRRPVWEFAPGASIVQGMVGRITFPYSASWYHNQSPRQIIAVGDATEPQPVGRLVDLNSYGGATGGTYGERINFYSNFWGPGFDVAAGVIGVWDRELGQNDGSAVAHWSVAISPRVVRLSDTRHSTAVYEHNIVNRAGPHTTNHKMRGDAGGTDGHFELIGTIVPEAVTFAQPGQTYDVFAGLVFSRSADNKPVDGLPARFWNSILIEPNTIVPGGAAFQVSGNDGLTGSNHPAQIIRAWDTWQYGLDFRSAAFSVAAIQTPGFAVTGGGQIIFTPEATARTLGVNGEVTFHRVSNTSLAILMRGTDGVTRSATLTLT